MTQEFKGQAVPILTSAESTLDLLTERVNHLFECLQSSSDAYDNVYEISRESYVNFVNFAPFI